MSAPVPARRSIARPEWALWATLAALTGLATYFVVVLPWSWHTKLTCVGGVFQLPGIGLLAWDLVIELRQKVFSWLPSRWRPSRMGSATVLGGGRISAVGGATVTVALTLEEVGEQVARLIEQVNGLEHWRAEGLPLELDDRESRLRHDFTLSLGTAIIVSEKRFLSARLVGFAAVFVGSAVLLAANLL